MLYRSVERMRRRVGSRSGRGYPGLEAILSDEPGFSGIAPLGIEPLASGHGLEHWGHSVGF
jgi:hypothetical protein